MYRKTKKKTKNNKISAKVFQNLLRKYEMRENQKIYVFIFVLMFANSFPPVINIYGIGTYFRFSCFRLIKTIEIVLIHEICFSGTGLCLTFYRNVELSQFWVFKT